MRDVGEDARRGRIYLPLDDLQRFGVARDRHAARARERRVRRADANSRPARARAWYRTAFALLPEADRRAQRPGLIMAAIYATLLDEIERDGFRVLEGRTSLTPMRKLLLAWRTWVRDAPHPARRALSATQRPAANAAGVAPATAVADATADASATAVASAAPAHRGTGPRRAAVIGAGWAGLAAAVELTEAGRSVVLFDAAPQPGGRARALELTVGGHRLRVDNGQHLLIGAYRDTLALIARIGGNASACLQRVPLRLASTDGLRLTAARLPAPWHLAGALLTARGLPWPQRWAIVRALAGLRVRGWQPPAGIDTVAQWLHATGQPQALADALWEPLCVGALNTPPQFACARTFCRVLRDSLGGAAGDADFLLPTGTLSEVLPDPALAWLRGHGADVRLRSACRRLQRARHGSGWRVEADGQSIPVDEVVVAVPPGNAARLLEGVAAPSSLAPLDAFAYESIATVWLVWESPVQLPPVIMLRERPESGSTDSGYSIADRTCRRRRARRRGAPATARRRRGRQRKRPAQSPGAAGAGRCDRPPGGRTDRLRRAVGCARRRGPARDHQLHPAAPSPGRRRAGARVRRPRAPVHRHRAGG